MIVTAVNGIGKEITTIAKCVETALILILILQE